MLQKLLLISLAGSLGTLARYGLSGVVQRVFGTGFPWGTLAVNFVGCLVAGALWVVSENKMSLGGEMRIIVFVGFMGAFTTFSSFMIETGALLRDGEWLLGFANIFLHLAVLAVSIIMGAIIGRML